MSLYIPNVPDPNDKLAVSALELRSNTNAADSYFGRDHVAFSASANQGFHQKVTMMSTTATHLSPIANTALIYPAQDSSALGTLDYSRGSNSGPPTPLTYIQSSSVTPFTIPASTTGPENIIDLSGTDLAVLLLYVSSTSTSSANVSLITSAGGSLSPNSIKSIYNVGNIIVGGVGGGQITLVSSTTSTISNVYWTAQFLRINTVT